MAKSRTWPQLFLASHTTFGGGLGSKRSNQLLFEVKSHFGVPYTCISYIEVIIIIITIVIIYIDIHIYMSTVYSIYMFDT